MDNSEDQGIVLEFDSLKSQSFAKEFEDEEETEEDTPIAEKSDVFDIIIAAFTVKRRKALIDQDNTPLWYIKANLKKFYQGSDIPFWNPQVMQISE